MVDICFCRSYGSVGNATDSKLSGIGGRFCEPRKEPAVGMSSNYEERIARDE